MKWNITYEFIKVKQKVYSHHFADLDNMKLNAIIVKLKNRFKNFLWIMFLHLFSLAENDYTFEHVLPVPSAKIIFVAILKYLNRIWFNLIYSIFEFLCLCSLVWCTNIGEFHTFWRFMCPYIVPRLHFSWPPYRIDNSSNDRKHKCRPKDKSPFFEWRLEARIILLLFS